MSYEVASINFSTTNSTAITVLHSLNDSQDDVSMMSIAAPLAIRCTAGAVENQIGVPGAQRIL